MSAKGTLPVVPFPSLLPPHRELGEAGMLEETKCYSAGWERGDKELQGIQKLLKSHLKTHLRRQHIHPASTGTGFQHPDRNIKAGRWEWFSSLTTRRYFQYPITRSLSTSLLPGWRNAGWKQQADKTESSSVKTSPSRNRLSLGAFPPAAHAARQHWKAFSTRDKEGPPSVKLAKHPQGKTPRYFTARGGKKSQCERH